jgi:hypothetical protein
MTIVSTDGVVIVRDGTGYRSTISQLTDYLIDNGFGSGGSVAWSAVTGKPSTFPPSAHVHDIADVTGLQAALDGKLTQQQVMARTLGC